MGRDTRPQHGVQHEECPVTWDVKTKQNIKWVATLGSQSVWQPGRRGRHGIHRHQQRRDARSQAAGRPRRADGFPRIRRRVPLAAYAGETRCRPRERLAVSGRRSSPLVEGDRLYYVSNRAKLTCLDIKGFTQRERRSGQGREIHRTERRRHHLGVRHDGGGRIASSQSGEFVSGVLRRSDLREHLERPG